LQQSTRIANPAAAGFFLDIAGSIR